MPFIHAIAALLLSVAPPPPATTATTDAAAKLADEAVATALTLPEGYKRDRVLRSVSRNLRWFGQLEAGLRAARAMSDNGFSEVPPGQKPAPPRYVPLKEAMPSGSPCDAGLWSKEGGGKATSPKARERWAETCLLRRDFHYIGMPERAEVRAAAAGLPAGDIKGGVLAMLIRFYGDTETLKFVQESLAADGARMPTAAREGVSKMLVQPERLYQLDRKAEAMTAARSSDSFGAKAAFIRLLVESSQVDDAIAVFETLGSTPPEFPETCFAWFGVLGGLRLEYLGNSPKPAIGAFLDRLPASPLYRRVCPNGMDADLMTSHLLAAGRYDAALVTARKPGNKPFLLVDTALRVGRLRYRAGNRDAARRLAVEAAAVLPPFDPGDPIPASLANEPDGSPALIAAKTLNFGERSGDTGRRFQIIQMLAATGATAEADALAHAQPAGALRAVALSAAVAGRAGLRFDEQAPSLDTIDANDL